MTAFNVQPGERLSAARENAWRGDVDRRLNTRPSGLAGNTAQAWIWQAFEQGRLILARVVERIGPAQGTPNQITYTVRAQGFDTDTGPMAPQLGRPTTDNAVTIKAAAVGDPCILLRYPDGDGAWSLALVVLTEDFTFFTCAPAPAQPSI